MISRKTSYIAQKYDLNFNAQLHNNSNILQLYNLFKFLLIEVKIENGKQLYRVFLPA